MRTLVAMATYSFNRLIMGKVEIGNFYCLIGDNIILFLQKCLLNSRVGYRLQKPYRGIPRYSATYRGTYHGIP